jgi:carboxylesterase type B
VTGNQGFLDQHLALKWVHENSHAFGGDNSKITLIGYDSGARFASLHLMYRPSNAFFRNVILQSGSPVNLADNLLSKNAASKRAEDFIKTYYNCESAKPIDCIKDADAFNLTLNSRLFLVNHMSKKSNK